jgi:hypothetical protein
MSDVTPAHPPNRPATPLFMLSLGLPGLRSGEGPHCEEGIWGDGIDQPPLPIKLRHSALFAWFVCRIMSAHLDACSPHRRTCHVQYETGRLSATGRPLQRPSGHCLSTRQNACTAMELEGSSAQRFAARDNVFRRQPSLRSSTRSTSDDGRSGFCDFHRRTHRCGFTAITGFTAGLADRCYCLSRTTRPDGGGAAWRTPCRTHSPRGSWSARILLLRSHFLGVQLVRDAPWGFARWHR